MKGPVEAALHAEGVRLEERRVPLNPRDRGLAWLLANQIVLAQALDALGQALVEDWEAVKLG